MRRWSRDDLECPWLDQVPGLEEFYNAGDASASAYATYVRAAIPDGEWELIRSAAARGQLTGSGRFVEEIERITGRRIEHRGQGRPKKDPEK